MSSICKEPPGWWEVIKVLILGQRECHTAPKGLQAPVGCLLCVPLRIFLSKSEKVGHLSL